MSLRLANAPIPVRDFINELITLVSCEHYSITPEHILEVSSISENKDDKNIDEISTEYQCNNAKSVLLPIEPTFPLGKEFEMFYMCYHLKSYVSRCKTIELLYKESRLDLAQLVNLTPGLCLKYDDSREGVRLQRIRVLKQFVGGYCGHYAYFNGLTLINAVTAKSPALSMLWLFWLSQRLPFWHRYFDTINQLSNYARTVGEFWPWVVSDIEKGCIERTYMSYLINADKAVHRLGENNVHVLQFAYNNIQTPIEDITKLQSAIYRFRNSDSTPGIVIMLGVTNHWLAVVIYKIKKEEQVATSNLIHSINVECDGKTGAIENLIQTGLTANDTSNNNSNNNNNNNNNNDNNNSNNVNARYLYRIVFLDSNNAPVLEADNQQIQKYWEKQVVKYNRKKKEVMSEWKKETFRQALEDERELMRILLNSVSGKTSLTYETIRTNIHRMLMNYHVNVDIASKVRKQEYVPAIPVPWFLLKVNANYKEYAETGSEFPIITDEYALQVLAWLEGWYRPKDVYKTIHDSRVKLGFKELDSELSICVTTWCTYVLTVLVTQEQIVGMFPILNEFQQTLTNILDEITIQMNLK